MEERMKKLVLAGLGLIRLSGQDANGLLDRLAAMGSGLLTTEAVPNEPLHIHPPANAGESEANVSAPVVDAPSETLAPDSLVDSEAGGEET